MHDILIRGMEMPSKGCLRCPFNLYYANAVYCNCMIIKLLGKPSEAKYPNEVNCPLHELPEHGALIDRDAIPYKKIMFDDDDFYYGVTQPYIDRMPIIVPASEEDG